jgi:prephenate dehydratase
VSDAIRRYAEDVRSGTCPSEAESFGLPRDLDLDTVAAIATEFAAQRGGDEHAPLPDDR